MVRWLSTVMLFLIVTLLVGSSLKAPGRVFKRVRTGAFMNMVSRSAGTPWKSSVIRPIWSAR